MKAKETMSIATDLVVDNSIEVFPLLPFLEWNMSKFYMIYRRKLIVMTFGWLNRWTVTNKIPDYPIRRLFIPEKNITREFRV